MKRLNAGIIIIGDEVLSGRTQDTNSNFIAKKLIESGIQLDEIKVIHDQMDIIIEESKDEKLDRSLIDSKNIMPAIKHDIMFKELFDYMMINRKYYNHYKVL